MTNKGKSKKKFLHKLPDSKQTNDHAIDQHETAENKDTEETLKESEQRYRTILENALIGIYRTTPDGKILLVNPALMKMLGYNSKEELLKRNLEETGYEPKYLRRDFKEIIEKEGRITGFESVWLRKDGTPVFIRESATACYDESGKIMYYEGIAEDISERKRAQEKIQENEERFRKIFEEGPLGMVIVNSEMHFVRANAAFCYMTGYSEEELSSLTFKDITHPDHLGRDIENIRKLFHGEIPLYKTEKRYITKNGSILWGSLTSTVIRDVNGEFLYFLTMVEDITERKGAEETIRTLGNAIEQGPSAIVITNEKGKIEFVNNKFTSTTQYTLEDVRGKSPRIFNPGHLTDKGYDNLWGTLLKGDTWKGELQNRRKDGTRFWEEITISALMNSNGIITNYILILNDITEKRQMLDGLIIAKEQAEESDRLKSAFLANMGHEIRTPLNIMIGFAEQLNDPELTSEEKSEYIDIIGKSGRGLLNIFNDIVCISKVEAGQMPLSVSEVNVNELIEKIHTSFKEQAEQKGLMMICSKGSASNDAFIRTDREKVNTILTNLVKNAIKFTREGRIETGYQLKGDHLEFYVKDSGAGIKPEQQEIIFEPFRQGSESLRRNYEGIGLGLSISKAYVEMLGGKIRVESRPGEGSVFYFTLPGKVENKQTEVAQTGEPEHEENYKFDKLKILIVEDNEYSAQLLEKIVKEHTRGILKAITGIEAVEICRKNPDIDLVLMDIQLPEMNGIEATRQIRKFNTDVKIIAQTAFVFTYNREQAIEAGCNDYISKPIDQALLWKLLKEYFNKTQN
jgi:PAS domain S-box-containing protein